MKSPASATTIKGAFILPNLNAAFRRLHEAAFLRDVS
jgi:hypothetical protein